MRRKDEAAHGEYRTKRLILERYDALAECIANGTEYQTVLEPPPAHPSLAHPESTRPDWSRRSNGRAGGLPDRLIGRHACWRPVQLAALRGWRTTSDLPNVDRVLIRSAMEGHGQAASSRLAREHLAIGDGTPDARRPRIDGEAMATCVRSEPNPAASATASITVADDVFLIADDGLGQVARPRPWPDRQ